eukprot:12937207-Prorocentrum_lima.AAC.1
MSTVQAAITTQCSHRTSCYIIQSDRTTRPALCGLACFTISPGPAWKEGRYPSLAVWERSLATCHRHMHE